MFNGTLLPFQELHENNLLKACADNEKLILQSPTGSGKTVLVSKFIDDYLDENPDTVFFWFLSTTGGACSPATVCWRRSGTLPGILSTTTR